MKNRLICMMIFLVGCATARKSDFLPNDNVLFTVSFETFVRKHPPKGERDLYPYIHVTPVKEKMPAAMGSWYAMYAAKHAKTVGLSEGVCNYIVTDAGTIEIRWLPKSRNWQIGMVPHNTARAKHSLYFTLEKR